MLTLVVKVENPVGKYTVIQSSDHNLVGVGAQGNSRVVAGKLVGSTWLCDADIPNKSIKLRSANRFDVSQSVCDVEPEQSEPEQIVEQSQSVATTEQSQSVVIKPVYSELPVVDFTQWSNEQFYVAPDSIAVFSNAYAVLQSKNSKPQKVIVTGDSGNGKTTMIESFAKFVGLDYLRVNCATMRDVTDWFGNIWVENQSMQFNHSEFITLLMRGNCVICLDEFNRVQSDLHNSLFPLLDDSACTSVMGHEFKVGPNVFIVATVNLGYQYGATFELDAAMFNRFDYILEVGALPFHIESGLLCKLENVDRHTSEQITRIANAIRESNVTVCSTRSTLSIARKVAHGMSIYDAFDCTIVRRIMNDEPGALIRKNVLDTVKSLVESSALV